MRLILLFFRMRWVDDVFVTVACNRAKNIVI